MPIDRGAVATVSANTGTASLVPGNAPRMIVTSTVTSATTNDATWDAWNQVYTISAGYNGRVATQATIHALRAHLNTVAYEAEMTGDTWTAWNIQYVANSITLATTNITTNAITYGTAANTATITVVENWDDTWGEWIRVQDADNLTRDERIARDAAAGRANVELRERYQREQDARLREELVAKDKAIVLLKSCLTKQQLEEYEKKKHFHLHVGDKVYRIEQGSHGNVKLIGKDGKVKRSFCIQPRGVPEGDAMLAQKLLLQTNEKGFYESANVTEYDKEGRHLGTFHGARAVDLLTADQQRAV